MGKTKFSATWQLKRSWLHPVRSDPYKARCSACHVDLSVVQGVGAVRRHEDTPKHIAFMKATATQNSFAAENGILSMTNAARKSHVKFTSEEQKWNAEILRVVNVIEQNYSFNSCAEDNSLYRRMFPDSAIAKSYEQADSKVKYVVQYGITPYVFKLIIADIKGQPFRFHFDETTTSQVKKQYDAYITYWSAEGDEIVTSYIGSLFVGHCPADDLLLHFQTFVSKLSLDLNYLMNLGMDGPYVNLSFQRKLVAMLERNDGTLIIDIGSCPLHKVNTAFSNAIAAISKHFDVDQFAIDLHFFFKYSAGRREDYATVGEVTDLIAQNLNKHCTTRWISLEKVLVKIIEQFPNITHYFLVIVPPLKGFGGKNGISSTERYQRIKSALSDKNVPILLAFIVFLSNDFNDFIKPLQTNEPMIHVLFQKSMTLIQKLLQKFVKTNKFINSKTRKCIGSNDLQELDVSSPEIQKVGIYLKCQFLDFTIPLCSNVQLSSV